MPTAQTLIIAAYRKTGQIVTATDSSQLSTGLEELNYMLNSWSSGKLAVPSLTLENFNLTVGQNNYSIGSSGNFNTVRPNSISGAYIRVDSNDYPVLPMSETEYNEITAKSTTGRPTRFYFLPSYSLAKIYFNYTPDSAYAFYFNSWKIITNISALGDTVSLPPEYEEMIVYNLAIRLGDNEPGIPLSPSVYAIAADTRDKVEHLHTTQMEVPESKFEFPVSGSGGVYNITADEYN